MTTANSTETVNTTVERHETIVSPRLVRGDAPWAAKSIAATKKTVIKPRAWKPKTINLDTKIVYFTLYSRKGTQKTPEGMLSAVRIGKTAFIGFSKLNEIDVWDLQTAQSIALKRAIDTGIAYSLTGTIPHLDALNTPRIVSKALENSIKRDDRGNETPVNGFITRAMNYFKVKHVIIFNDKLQYS